MDRIKSFNKHGKIDYDTIKGKRKFRKAIYDTREIVLRTRVSADWLNDTQEEIVSVIESVGTKPETGKEQLLDSIIKIIDNIVEKSQTHTEAFIKEQSKKQRDHVLELENKIAFLSKDQEDTKKIIDRMVSSYKEGYNLDWNSELVMYKVKVPQIDDLKKYPKLVHRLKADKDHNIIFCKRKS